jgi:hypothetical protein
LSRQPVTGRRWKKAAALHCAIVLRPDLDAKNTKKLAQAILSLGNDEDPSLPKKTQINDAQVCDVIRAHSQCVMAARDKCPLLIFGKQLADELNQFFHGEDDENPSGRGRRAPVELAGEELE